MTTMHEGPDSALPMRASALLLDMDGTLVDSGPAVERSWNRLFRAYDAERTFDHELHGVPARHVISRVLGHLDDEDQRRAAQEIEEIEMDDVEGIVTLPGTERLLAELDAAATKLGHPTWTIVTSCTQPLFEARWARTGLPVPPDMVTADQVTHGKPDPEPYALALTRLGLRPEDAVVIEDSPGGLDSARAAGIRTVAVTTTTPAGELTERADALLTSLDDVEVRVEDGALLLTRRDE
ncbi:MAG: HAD-IA family hydrolase [Brachybacterium sp.]|nr:HAD-IA family hydrolase [Brachybacterium sp.]